MDVRVSVWAWVTLVVLLSAPLLQTPTTTQAAAAPHNQRRGGRFVAGALGFIGGFLLGRHSGRRHGGCRGCGGGCGGCGGGKGGCGWCGGGHYGRKRRSIDEVMEKDALEEMYLKVAEEDVDGCGLRLVCELAQKDPNYLTGHETLLLLPYRGREDSDVGTYFGQYDKAVWHGQKGNPCSELYSLCSYPARSIMAYYIPLNTTLLQEQQE
ncbi:hypothetical protein Pcinc_017144 [Petrolisthes cinctipes]|uniref:Uncharacterized protein n=1 Tax=Petrolisthes cinctipes TaxID=88211 RepID=A0AAE1FRB7_PETCI|nr:hypothetical protein Pcinc_017144 [Petrolisthes cinctipes]